jgi:hypothetical protein
MRFHDFSRSVFRPQPPPLWYVTNGELTVGPVVTPLLLRGVEAQRVPDYCHVRMPTGNWRPLGDVRELASLWGKPESHVHTASLGFGDETFHFLRGIRDEDALCYEVTRLTLLVTGAESAMLHCRDGSGRSLTTRAVLGPMSHERLGATLPEHDPVLRSARLGRPVIGPPYGPAEDALSIRFSTSQGGVGAAAMIPILLGDTLAAMLELSRPGRAFRRMDLERSERIVQRSLLARLN